METKYLVNPEETPEVPNSAYGAVNSCFEEPKDCAFNALQMESSFEAQVSAVPRDRSCSCTIQVGECDCGVRKASVQLEPWAKYKTMVMAVGLALFGIWVIIISVVGGRGQL